MKKLSLKELSEGAGLRKAFYLDNGLNQIESEVCEQMFYRACFRSVDQSPSPLGDVGFLEKAKELLDKELSRGKNAEDLLRTSQKI